MSRTTAPANSRGRIGLCADAVDAIAAHVGIAQQVGFCVGESNLKDESSGPSMQQARQAASTVRSLPDGVLYTLCYLYQTTAARVRTTIPHYAERRIPFCSLRPKTDVKILKESRG